MPQSLPPLSPLPPATPRFRTADLDAHLDMGVIGELCMGVSLAGVRKLLGGLLSDQAGTLARLLDDLDQARREPLRDRAHALKGACASLGLRGLAATTLRIERDGAGFSADDCAQAAQTLRRQWDTTRALLERMGFL